MMALASQGAAAVFVITLLLPGKRGTMIQNYEGTA
jgi:hypothetical protein